MTQDTLTNQLIAILDGAGADAVRVCEGGGTEDLAASLAVTIAKFRYFNNRFKDLATELSHYFNSEPPAVLDRNTDLFLLLVECLPGWKYANTPAVTITPKNHVVALEKSSI